MPLHIPSETEYNEAKAGNAGGYFPLEEEEYRAKITAYTKHNEITKYNTDGHETVRFTLIPTAFANDPDAELVDKEGNLVPDDKRLIFFFDNKHLGFTPVVSKNRKFIAAARGVPIGEPIDADSWDELYESFLGKEVVVAVTEKDGNNTIRDVRPVKEKKARPKKAELVAAAEDIFDTEPAKPSSDEDEY